MRPDATAYLVGMSTTSKTPRVCVYPPPEHGPGELDRLSRDTGINSADLARQIWAAGMTWARDRLAPAVQAARAGLTPQTAGGPR